MAITAVEAATRAASMLVMIMVRSENPWEAGARARGGNVPVSAHELEA